MRINNSETMRKAVASARPFWGAIACIYSPARPESAIAIFKRWASGQSDPRYGSLVRFFGILTALKSKG
jgi:hypothetical protein